MSAAKERHVDRRLEAISDDTRAWSRCVDSRTLVELYRVADMCDDPLLLADVFAEIDARGIDPTTAPCLCDKALHQKCLLHLKSSS